MSKVFKTPRPTPTANHYYLLKPDGIVDFVGRVNTNAIILKGYDDINSWEMWKAIIRKVGYVVDGTGRETHAEVFISRVDSIRYPARSKSFNYYMKARSRWFLEGDVTLDSAGYTINFRDFM